MCNTVGRSYQGDDQERAEMKIRIGRTSGPCTDKVVETEEFCPYEKNTIKDVLAMVNKVSGNKEGWFIQVGEEGPIIVPEVK